MTEMIRMGLAGLGKMGLSHLAILNAHPDIELVAACDGKKYLTKTLERSTGLKTYGDFETMLTSEQLDAVVIATPSSSHATLVGFALERGLHVFCEKPFVLELAEGQRLVTQADESNLVTQVGYHNRYVGTFKEARRLVQSGALGEVHHFMAEAYGPVVVRPQSATWRSRKNEGGGVVYDYACHALDVVNFVLGPVETVAGVIRNGIFSRDVDDEVYCSLVLKNRISGQLAANWSDESQRKMTTRLSVWGTGGHIKVDRQECAIYLREPHSDEVRKGWTILNTTELTDEVWFYLRGEEYSAQIDDFANRIGRGAKSHACDFRSALQTDLVVAKINGLADSPEMENGSPGQVPSLARRFRNMLVGGDRG